MFRGIDLYSDTVTQPTVAMKQVMMAAKLGDEQRGEDPTTRQLEEHMATILGHSAAMFFPSATMANEVAIRLLCEPGDELIAAENCHLFMGEGGGPAIHAQVMARPIPTRSGIFSGDELAQAFRPNLGYHYPVSRLFSVENTTNMGGGVPWSLAELTEIWQVGRQLGLQSHLDGSRLFNAAIASKLSPEQIASPFDAVTLCFSKGLGCPLGAGLAFDRRHWEKVRRLKQVFGGALRQSGIVAGAALYALNHHVERLGEDHENARRLATGLGDIKQLAVESQVRSTNMVFFRWHGTTGSPLAFGERCLAKGVRFSQVGENRFRGVTHLNISSKDIADAVTIVREVCKELAP